MEKFVLTEDYKKKARKIQRRQMCFGLLCFMQSACLGVLLFAKGIFYETVDYRRKQHHQSRLLRYPSVDHHGRAEYQRGLRYAEHSSLAYGIPPSRLRGDDL